jgi:hypothetical protein
MSFLTDPGFVGLLVILLWFVAQEHHNRNRPRNP